MTHNRLTLHIYFPVTDDRQFLIGGMGVEDKENGLRDIPILLQVTSLLYGWIKGMLKYQSHKHKMNYNKHFRDFCRCFSWILEEEGWFFVFHVA